MRIAKIIGTVILNRSHPSLTGSRLKLAVPYSLTELELQTEPTADALVVYDEFGAGEGSIIALSESREAAAPFYPEQKPVDAYNAGILDDIHIQSVTES